MDGVFSDLLVEPGDFLIQHLALHPATHQRLARRTCKVVATVLETFDEVLVQRMDALRQKDAELGKQPAQPIYQRGTLLDESGPHAVKDKHALLGRRLDRHETHLWTAGRFADCLGILCIILHVWASFAIGGSELRWNEPDIVSERA
jgi:hypothetical protein